MKIDILSLFPNMFDGFINESIIKRAIDKKLVEINVIDQFGGNGYEYCPYCSR